MIITPANINDYPVGSEVIVNCGAMFPQHYGVIVEHRHVPATRWNEAGMCIAVEYTYCDEYGEEIKTVSTFERIDEKGIGCHMHKKAEPVVANKKPSPWAAN